LSKGITLGILAIYLMGIYIIDIYIYTHIGSYWENRDLLGTDFSWLSLVSFLRKTNYRAKESWENYVARKGCRIY
jgi:hypothetical protein